MIAASRSASLLQTMPFTSRDAFEDSPKLPEKPLEILFPVGPLVTAEEKAAWQDELYELYAFYVNVLGFPPDTSTPDWYLGYTRDELAEARPLYKAA